MEKHILSFKNRTTYKKKRKNMSVYKFEMSKYKNKKHNKLEKLPLPDDMTERNQYFDIWYGG